MTQKVNEIIDQMELPKEIDLAYGGDRELFEDAIDDMLMAIVLAIILVYIVMAAQFESFKYPFVIMFSVPLMAIGVAVGLVWDKYTNQCDGDNRYSCACRDCRQ